MYQVAENRELSVLSVVVLYVNVLAGRPAEVNTGVPTIESKIDTARTGEVKNEQDSGRVSS